MKNVGTCALTVVVSNNTVYVANAGDSKGILVFE
jgi:serine/threonine protein phosphatase PrpC